MTRHTPSRPPRFTHTDIRTPEPGCWRWLPKRAEWASPPACWAPPYPILLPAGADALDALRHL